MVMIATGTGNEQPAPCVLELLRRQAQAQAHTLTNCVLALAFDPLAPEQLDACASAARSFEGTARTVGLQAGAELAQTMEECFVAVRRGEVELQQGLIDLLFRSVDLLDCMARLPHGAASQPETRAGRKKHRGPNKRVLVVDDSLEVRELERKLLTYGGYSVETAADGIDAWNAVVSGNFDLVLTDVDMPLLDGIRLIRLIRKDRRFRKLPILLACDNDSAQQRWSGFDAGADYYVIKGNFHDTLVEAVATLIGPVQP
jgi:CheY-like chemotaxis protein/HPt (histidine-containing phosphotransfer) domain-containing protein